MSHTAGDDPAGQAPPLSPTLEGDLEAGTIIRQECSSRWPSDYSMLAHCVRAELEALDDLRDHRPIDVPLEVRDGIRTTYRRRWARDFSMWLHCEQRQVDAHRAARDEGILPSE